MARMVLVYTKLNVTVSRNGWTTSSLPSFFIWPGTVVYGDASPSGEGNWVDYLLIQRVRAGWD